jgi:hypothetical protein
MLEQKLDLAVVVLRRVAALLCCIAEHMDGDYTHVAVVLLQSLLLFELGKLMCNSGTDTCK